MGKPPFRRRKKVCEFCEAKIEHIDYKQVDVLKRHLTERGKILPRRVKGTCAKYQRQLLSALSLHATLLFAVFKRLIMKEKLRTFCSRLFFFYRGTSCANTVYIRISTISSVFTQHPLAFVAFITHTAFFYHPVRGRIFYIVRSLNAMIPHMMTQIIQRNAKGLCHYLLTPTSTAGCKSDLCRQKFPLSKAHTDRTNNLIGFLAPLPNNRYPLCRKH